MATDAVKSTIKGTCSQDDVYKSLHKVRLAMETENHKHSILGKKVENSVSANKINLGEILLDKVRFHDQREEQQLPTPTPSLLTHDAQLSVPPLRPHNLDWLLDEVPDFLEVGFVFDSSSDENSPKRTPTLAGRQQVSSVGERSPPTSSQLASAFQALSSTDSSKRKVSVEDLFVPLTASIDKQLPQVIESNPTTRATSWKSSALGRVPNLPLPQLKKLKKKSATTA